MHQGGWECEFDMCLTVSCMTSPQYNVLILTRVVSTFKDKIKTLYLWKLQFQTLTFDLLCVCPRPERLEPLVADQLEEASAGLCTVDPRLLFQCFMSFSCRIACSDPGKRTYLTL